MLNIDVWSNYDNRGKSSCGKSCKSNHRKASKYYVTFRSGLEKTRSFSEKILKRNGKLYSRVTKSRDNARVTKIGAVVAAIRVVTKIICACTGLRRLALSSLDASRGRCARCAVGRA